MMHKDMELSSPFPQDGSGECAIGHRTVKHICGTCKAPCYNCIGRPVSTTTSTDTHDFERYLDSLTKKSKSPVKVKTIGTDTCDLESHFDYYKVERTKAIQKNASTDCADLNYRRLLNRKRSKPPEKPFEERGEETDAEFAWSVKSEARTLSRCSMKKADDLDGEEDSGIPEEMLKSEENKENYSDKGKEIAFEESSSSDESDVDLVTSTKLSKCRKIARAHKLSLTQVDDGAEKVFKCNVCGRTFPKKYLCVLHLGSHVDGDAYKCVSCESRFETLDRLTCHATEVHRALWMNHSDNILADVEMDEKQEVGKDFAGKAPDAGFHCVLCLNQNESTNRFPSYKALYLHKRLKHGVKETKPRSKIERKPRLKREFICLFCGKEFKSNKALNDHLPVHTGEKNYLCDICNKSYTTSANLQIHKRTHMGLKNFKCTLCEKAFHKKDSLKVHLRKHSGERPFQCDLCPMRFDRNFILKNHRLRHFSEKKYICPVCGKAFTTHGGLNNHEKSHRRDPGAKKPRKPAVKPTLDTENAVICDVCGKVYSTRSNLRIHKFVHLGVKPFQCPVCQQSYAKKDSMLTHMRKHTDERPFSCETCGMAFYRNHTLKTHRLRHTGERPHKCHMCGKSFTQSSSLTYHIKHHNRKEEKKKNGGQLDDGGKAHKKKKVLSSKVDESNEKDSPTGMVVVNNGSYAKMVPVIKKEVLVLDEALVADPSGKKEEADRDGTQMNMTKLNYYVATKEATKPRGTKEDGKSGDVKDGMEVWSKTAEGTGTTLPITTGEILNATFISDENGDVIPFGSMTLQSVTTENIMISPLIKVESGVDGDRKDRSSRYSVGSDPKLRYSPGKVRSNCQILNLKDGRTQQRIQLINPEPLSFHIQVPVSCTAVAGDDGVLSGIATAAGTYYTGV